MTMLTELSPELLTEVLRGDRDNRPPRDCAAAGGLRALLEDRLFAILGPQRRESPLVVTSSMMRYAGAPRDLPDSPLSRVRGVVISTLFRLLVAHIHVEDPLDDALCVWRSERPHDDVFGLIEHLDADQAARLRADVAAHFATLVRHLGSVASSWRPRTSQRTYQILGGGNVELRDVVDLVVGSAVSPRASVALFDITTSPLGAGAERVMRYHALVDTLRTSIVPLRTSIFSSATGEVWSLDVDTELLVRAVDDVTQVLTGLHAAS